ncbi:MAG: DNA polymerase Y family protein [Gemmatimonadota bacterium]|nr:DNA polymerase Y family protein [Gemmatimonadota bacterium]
MLHVFRFVCLPGPYLRDIFGFDLSTAACVAVVWQQARNGIGVIGGIGIRQMKSDYAVCVWIPLFPLRCEGERRPDLAGRPTALLAPEDGRRVWQASSLARRQGVRTGLTVGQAIGLCPTLALLEPDPIYYDERFAQLLLQLEDVSPVIEPVELGRAYVGVDGLEGLYGPPARQVEVIAEAASHDPSIGRSVDPPVRLGWAKGKFTAWVAATRAKPGAPVIVADATRASFLHAQPLAALPLHRDNHRRLLQLGLRTLGDLAALPEAAVTAQFGREGRAAWRLAAGACDEPVVSRPRPQPILATLDYPSPVADRGMLAHTMGVLIEHALRDPRRTGWRVQTVRVRAALEQGASWMIDVMLKEPAALRERILAPLVTRLEQRPPTGAVERLVIEFTAFARGTDELQLFARDAAAAARAGRRRALQLAAREIHDRLKRQVLYRVVEVQPWSRLPERRYALIAFEP